MTKLLSPFSLRQVTLKNRIVASPMCQYRATDGHANPWHDTHYAGLARGGVSLVVVEATAVSKEGRITPGCLGLWEAGQEPGLRRIASLIKEEGAVPGIQLGHAGRKASISRPWEGDSHLMEATAGGWDTVAPSPLAYGHNLPKVPGELTIDDIRRVRDDFVAAACRAADTGFEWLELHFAHGFLAQTFFSVRTNKRADRYGGDFAGRTRFMIETLAAVREVWPRGLPLTVRFGCQEFDGRDNETASEVLELVKQFRIVGVDLLDVSIGFTEYNDRIPWGPGMLVETSRKLKQLVGIPTAVSWNVEEPELAASIVELDQADLIYIAKALLANPHYPFEIAKALGVAAPSWVLPAPYARWLERY
ncbi:NADH:flavin oxidoreductase/NADH oxidase [Rhizobium sp. AG207R]|uniref:NADH:flavin oxidoreductase/NADH oxidase n=1 Tax=Rhizobium sp. AG207R TaxID=2802287 RepID=UPI0022AC2510|nr:NADH:flavin oxidoreductase/NADH oxidase [Rhizobium sp. AG207R]MCZ3374365.1 NADH:flavin oxidoreductase/NADH oxidase [Rhizobium sp. AG207R]